MTDKKKSARGMLTGGLKVLMVAVVLAFLGLQSINFFLFIFPPEQWYYSALGFGLTSAGVVVYLTMFKQADISTTQKTVSLVMMVVCLLGELATAGFGMQIEAWTKLGYEMTSKDFEFMVRVVQVLALFHGIGFIVYFAGDDIAELLADDDKDGIPNVVDKDYRRRQYASEAKANPTPRQQK